MQEVFEKIKESLEAERKLAEEATEQYIKSNLNHFKYAHTRGRARGFDESVEIVNQVAEEYNQSLANNNQSLTNADKIRSMTDEKLAEFLFEQTHCDYCNIRTKCRQIDADNCHDVFLVWLQSKAEE